MEDFFYRNDCLDYLALRPLSHITANWELSWDSSNNYYEEEDRSFAKALNRIIKELNEIDPPKNYHQHEDQLVLDFIKKLKHSTKKKVAVGMEITFSC